MMDPLVEDVPIRIVMADDNRSYCDAISAYVQYEPGIELLCTVYDGESAVEACIKHNPDVLLLDLVLPKLDGMGVLEAVRSIPSPPKVLMFTAFGQEDFISRALELGVDYYIMKPFDIETLFVRVRQLMQPAPSSARVWREQQQALISTQAADIIRSLGIPPNLKGFAYLREAVTLAVQSPDLVSYMTTKLYPMIAQRMQTTPEKVERAIRHAIERAWTRGEIATNYELFAYSIDISKGKPTNSLFIARVADHVRLEIRSD